MNIENYPKKKRNYQQTPIFTDLWHRIQVLLTRVLSPYVLPFLPKSPYLPHWGESRLCTDIILCLLLCHIGVPLIDGQRCVMVEPNVRTHEINVRKIGIDVTANYKQTDLINLRPEILGF